METVHPALESAVIGIDVLDPVEPAPRKSSPTETPRKGSPWPLGCSPPPIRDAFLFFGPQQARQNALGAGFDPALILGWNSVLQAFLQPYLRRPSRP